ncbi:MAG TPA: hypothetical protein VF731_11900 [Solirubrobacterales bacterium]
MSTAPVVALHVAADAGEAEAGEEADALRDPRDDQREAAGDRVRVVVGVGLRVGVGEAQQRAVDPARQLAGRGALDLAVFVAQRVPLPGQVGGLREGEAVGFGELGKGL